MAGALAILLQVDLGLGLVGQVDQAAQVVHLGQFELLPATAGDAAIQGDVTVANAHQAAHLHFLGFPQAAHFTVATLGQGDVEPLVQPFTAGRLDLVELGHAVFQLHALAQALQHGFGDLAKDAHRVFPLHFVARVHQPVGQLAVGGEQQQAGGVDVEATHRNPAGPVHLGQTIKHGGTTFRIVTGTHLPFGLVIRQHAADLLLGRTGLDLVTIHPDHGVHFDAIPQHGDLAIHADPTCGDQGLHLTTGALTRAGQYFLQFFTHRVYLIVDRCPLT
ncbi:hypothetical protein D3C78_800600 [compost metagenome]